MNNTDTRGKNTHYKRCVGFEFDMQLSKPPMSICPTLDILCIQPIKNTIIWAFHRWRVTVLSAC